MKSVAVKLAVLERLQSLRSVISVQLACTNACCHSNCCNLAWVLHYALNLSGVFHMLKLCYNHSVMIGLALFQAVLMTVHTCLVTLHEWLCQSFSSIQWQWLLSNDVKSRSASAKRLCQVYSASLTECCAMSTRVKRHSGCLINKVLEM